MTCSELTTASPVKLLLARLLTCSMAGRVIAVGTRNRIRHYGLGFDVSGPEFSPSVKAQLFWHLYERAEVRMIRRHLQGASTVVELGASLGITSAHIVSLMTNGGRILCVEANPYLIGGLQERIASFSKGVVVEVLNGAISDNVGMTSLSLGANNIDSHLSDGRSGGRNVTVPAMTLRHVLSSHAIHEFDLVSDIEGSEASFLLGDPHALAGCRRAVLELHESTRAGRQLTPLDLIDAAKAQGFRVVDNRGPVVALERVNRPFSG
jgi:FkbM family methyltransferase